MTVDDLPARVPLSRSVLDRRLREHVGLSPMGLSPAVSRLNPGREETQGPHADGPRRAG
jgi:hypothetical protein